MKHYQFQVVVKPSPDDIQDLYVDSLRAIGIEPADHDLRFEEDNWESPTLGAWGVGWQVLLDGMEITQFTYFQQAGGIDLAPCTAEITYGLERLTMFLTRTRNVMDIEWAPGVKYGEVRQAGRVRGVEVRLRDRPTRTSSGSSSRGSRPSRGAASRRGSSSRPTRRR